MLNGPVEIINCGAVHPTTSQYRTYTYQRPPGTRTYVFVHLLETDHVAEHLSGLAVAELPEATEILRTAYAKEHGSRRVVTR